MALASSSLCSGKLLLLGPPFTLKQLVIFLKENLSKLSCCCSPSLCVRQSAFHGRIFKTPFRIVLRFPSALSKTAALPPKHIFLLTLPQNMYR